MHSDPERQAFDELMAPVWREAAFREAAVLLWGADVPVAPPATVVDVAAPADPADDADEDDLLWWAWDTEDVSADPGEGGVPSRMRRWQRLLLAAVRG